MRLKTNSFQMFKKLKHDGGTFRKMRVRRKPPSNLKKLPFLSDFVIQKLGLADTNIQPELTLTLVAHTTTPCVYCEWSPCPGQRGELLFSVIPPRWGGWQVSVVKGDCQPRHESTYSTTDTHNVHDSQSAILTFFIFQLSPNCVVKGIV